MEAADTAAMLRVALAVLALMASGCIEASLEADAVGGDDGTSFAACALDTDCTLAGASCCDCPSFAVPATTGWADSCEDVECAPGGSCTALVARCAQGTCVAGCAPVTCELACADGFAVGASGCQVCACASRSSVPACQLDSDCAQVPADCCGCARGGADTAVPAGEVGAHVDGLMCPAWPSCPDVDTCAAGATPRCLVGRCALGAPGDEPTPPASPITACGRRDLPPCPAGQQCTLNSDETATRLGLGTCR